MTLLAVVLLLAVGLWLLRVRQLPPTTPGEGREPIEKEELEAAEREVRDLDLDQRPEDGFEGDDWGPGTAKK